MSFLNRKTVSIVLFTMLFSVLMSIPASANEPLKSQVTNRFDTAINHSGTIVTVSANAKSTSTVNKIAIKMNLQKKNGSSFITVKTWSSTTNSSSASMRKTAGVSSKATYRVKTVFTMYSGNKKETITKIAYA